MCSQKVVTLISDILHSTKICFSGRTLAYHAQGLGSNSSMRKSWHGDGLVVANLRAKWVLGAAGLGSANTRHSGK